MVPSMFTSLLKRSVVVVKVFVIVVAAVLLVGCGVVENSALVWPPAVLGEPGVVPRLSIPPHLQGGQAHTYEITIVDGETKSAVPFAEVMYMEAPINWGRMDYAERLHAERLRSDTEAFLSRYGARAHADASGFIRLNLTASAGLLMARSGGYCGELSVHHGDVVDPEVSVHRIELRQPVIVEVQAVDSVGRIQVGMPMRVEFGDSGYALRVYADEANAVARIIVPALVGAEDLRAIKIHPAVLGCECQATVVDGMTRLRGRYIVECPDTGSVIVKATDYQADGEAFFGHLMLVDAEVAASPRAWYRPWQMAGVEACPDGDFVFPHVALGKDYATPCLGVSTLSRVNPSPPGGGRVPLFVGPTKPGQCVVVNLSVNRKAPVLEAVISGQIRGFLCNERVAFVLELAVDGTSYTKRYHARTNADGSVRVRLPEFVQSADIESVRVDIIDENGMRVGVGGGARILHVTSGSVLELGVVEVRQAPCLVRLLTKNGNGAVVRIWHKIQVLQGSADGPEDWADAYPEYTEVWADGSQAYYTNLKGMRWRVIFGEEDARAPGATYPEPVEFEPGGLLVVNVGRE
ncbi:MAG: hypothetical protein ACI9SE_002671 [Neolewinella sp.]|jgi:hypothetical protein